MTIDDAAAKSTFTAVTAPLLFQSISDGNALASKATLTLFATGRVDRTTDRLNVKREARKSVGDRSENFVRP
jgi:hypothetical protein